ncbi:MAG: VOC family protein, partial [Actinomycetota bacterium]|nr:VOC family protein [Actinomycetota bacterium]
MTAWGADWRVVGGVATAWFDAPSLSAGAALARGNPLVAVDLRADGVRVRAGEPQHAAEVSVAAREGGLTANPAVLQELSVVVESGDPSRVAPFWRRVLDYAPAVGEGLADPLRRDPAMRFRQSDEVRPLRNRVHLDVVRPAAGVELADAGEASGPYGVCRSDPDGNEVDLVPGDALGEGSDWQTVFSAMVCYRTTRRQQLAAAVAELADDAGFPLLVDVRPELVIVGSSKDRWEDDAFAVLAGKVQAAARELGATADPALPRFVQLFLDAADVDAVREFWRTVLGYVPDWRAGVSDIHDPRRLNPVLVFQQLGTADTERRKQRNRIRFELAVPPELAEERLATALAAGGRQLGEWRLA